MAILIPLKPAIPLLALSAVTARRKLDWPNPKSIIDSAFDLESISKSFPVIPKSRVPAPT